jgi:hypothetical protein
VPITNDAGLVQVSPGAGAVDLTGPAAGYPNSPDRYRPSGSPNVARTVPGDDLVVDAAADWASELGATQAVATSDGSPFQDLAATEFSSAVSRHGIQVAPGKPPAKVAVTGTGKQAVYEPGQQRLSIYGSSPMSLELSAELDPKLLPNRQFCTPSKEPAPTPPRSATTSATASSARIWTARCSAAMRSPRTGTRPSA